MLFFNLKKIKPIYNKSAYYSQLQQELIDNGIEVWIGYQKKSTIRNWKKEENYRWQKKQGVKFIQYKNKEELVSKIEEIKKIKKIENLYLNVYDEKKIESLINLKKEIGQLSTEDASLFTNKKKQRLYLEKNYISSIPKYYYIGKNKEIDFKKVEEIGFPLVLKPVGGINSKATFKINSKSELIKEIKAAQKSMNKLVDLGYKDKGFLLEEFIDGDFYTIDYFVDQHQNINVSNCLINSKIAFELGLDDMCVMNEKSCDRRKVEFNDRLNSFIKNTVSACKIKNTFVHHEFKYTSKKELKTIELNGRVGGFRIEFYKKAFNQNILLLPFKKTISRKMRYSIGYSSLRPKKNGKVVVINELLIEKMKKLKSFHRISLNKCSIGDQVGLAKNGFNSLGIVMLKHIDKNQFDRDMVFLEKECLNYVEVV